MSKIVIDPVTRVEGHLKIEAVVENGVVKEAKSSGMMYRGLENILKGRDPRDAARIMQRICGVCPTSHGLTAAYALDEAYGVAGMITDNGRILRNLIQGANFVQSHILHFYHLAALDYVDVTAVADYNGSDPALITSEQTMDPPYSECHYHFRVYRDWLDAVPGHLRDLSMYLTETDQKIELFFFPAFDETD